MAGLNKPHEFVSSLRIPAHHFDPPAKDVRAQLARIMAGTEFNRSPRLRRFLQFIVDETLSGREEQIKAYTIGLAVYDRDEQFDPSIDPIVRIEAGRLRRALEHYYLTQGADDAIAIDIPKGAYRPVITKRTSIYIQPNSSPGLDLRMLQRLLENMPESREHESFLRRIVSGVRPAWLIASLSIVLFSLAVTFIDRHNREIGNSDASIVMTRASGAMEKPDLGRVPVLLVLPFHSDDDLGQPSAAARVTDGIARSLTRQADFNVRRAASVNGTASSHLEINPTVDYVVSGSVRKIDNRLRIFVQLTNVGAQASIWSRSYDHDLNSDGIEREDDIARSIVTELAKLPIRITPVER